MRSNRIFFQNEGKMKAYTHSIWNSKKDIECFYHLGVALGYSPSACEHYTYKAFERSDTMIKMHGMSFLTDHSLVIENIRWLHKNYALRDELCKIWVFDRETNRKIFVKGRKVDFDHVQNRWEKIYLNR